MNDKDTAQIRRVAKYEAMFDDVTAALDTLEGAIERLAALEGEIAALEKYYTGKRWKEDFAADEAGLIPSDVKRGVLSEDGLYDLLDRAKAAKSALGLLGRGE